MVFAQPANLRLLFFVVLAAFLTVWAEQRKRIDVSRFGTPGLVQALSSSVSRTRRRWKAFLSFLALVSVILSLARPRWGTDIQMTARRGVQVIVALDVSASMLAEDVKPNRLTRAKLTVEELMQRLGGNEIGLVLFSGAAFVMVPLTADFNTARSFLSATGPQMISRPGTALEEALRVAIRGFREGIASHQVILLLTDGEGHEGNALDAADRAAEADIIINAIGFGSSVGEPIPMRDSSGNLLGYKKDTQGQTVLSRLDETTLRQIADTTGGLYYRASVGGEEIAAISEAVSALDTGELASQFETRGLERHQYFTGIALLALVAELFIGDRTGRKT
jgi:Ca-activated chloride channel family protein